MNQKSFLEYLEKRGLKLNQRQVKQLNDYASFLAEYNEKINLTNITEYEEVLEKHFLDSLLAPLNHKIEGSLVDVGTGAGFPGMVLKICYPELKVILLEPIKKRCIFLNETIKLLDLKDIEVINIRGEEYSLKNREKYDYVTARAVGNLSILIEICGSLVKKGGYFIALRGSKGKQELKDAENAYKKLGFEIAEEYEEVHDYGERGIYFLKKIKEGNKKYPRNYSLIKNNPL